MARRFSAEPHQRGIQFARSVPSKCRTGDHARATYRNRAWPQTRTLRPRHRCPCQQCAQETGPGSKRRTYQGRQGQRLSLRRAAGDEMKLSVHSLFLKIFLWFWATVILTGIALILTFIFEPHSVPSQWESTLRGTAAFTGAMAVESVERGGKPAASEYLERVEIETRLRACLFA